MRPSCWIVGRAGAPQRDYCLHGCCGPWQYGRGVEESRLLHAVADGKDAGMPPQLRTRDRAGRALGGCSFGGGGRALRGGYCMDHDALSQDDHWVDADNQEVFEPVRIGGESMSLVSRAWIYSAPWTPWMPYHRAPDQSSHAWPQGGWWKCTYQLGGGGLGPGASPLVATAVGNRRCERLQPPGHYFQSCSRHFVSMQLTSNITVDAQLHAFGEASVLEGSQHSQVSIIPPSLRHCHPRHPLPRHRSRPDPISGTSMCTQCRPARQAAPRSRDRCSIFAPHPRPP